MAAARFSSPEIRKPAGSPRPKGRDNAKDTLCRNVLIYGHCRYEDTGCSFNHEPNKPLAAQAVVAQSETKAKGLNLDSPSFTMPGSKPVTKESPLTVQLAGTAFFTPGADVPTVTPAPSSGNSGSETIKLNPAKFQEFTPQNYEAPLNPITNGTNTEPQTPYDPFSMASVAQGMPSASYNPYLVDENSSMGGSNTGGYFPAQAAYNAPTQPLQYHLYAPVGPHKEDLAPYQRLVHDFFISEVLRDELQKKSEASQQVMNVNLPTLDHYHSLVALDTSHQKSATAFGFPSWVYKATSSKNGNFYSLRRIEGFRLTNEHAIRVVKDWRKIHAAGVVSVIDAFTTRAFGDSSLIFVTNYHPLSKTLADHHAPSTTRFGVRIPSSIKEDVLWGYIVQIAVALKSVHEANLAVRCWEASKIIITDKNRIRFGACSVLDVVHYEMLRPIAELQEDDFLEFGKLIVSIATSTPKAQLNTTAQLKAQLDQISRMYTSELQQTLVWLLTPLPQPEVKTIRNFIVGISAHMAESLDGAFHQSDSLTSDLYRELENGRIARLLMKLGAINERPEYDGDKDWAETGSNYMLKLFRDYVFHQVDANGRAVVDLAHMLRCLNKLDAGSEEKIALAGRDEQSVLYASFKELKKLVASAFAELLKSKGAPQGGRYN